MKKQISKVLCSSLLTSSLIGGFTTQDVHAGSEPFIGEIMWFGGNFCPRGWAEAAGQLLPVNQNQALFSILGTLYGGDGRTTFALPDLRGRVAVNAGHAPGLSSYTQGQKVGQETTSQVPAHAHGLGNGVTATLKANGSTASLENNLASPAGNLLANGQRAAVYAPVPATSGEMVDMNSNSITVSGSTQTSGQINVDIRQPTLVLKACIAVVGIFPSRS